MLVIPFDEDQNTPIPNEVRFEDRGSAVIYARKLGESGYIASVTHKDPHWIVKYGRRKERNNPLLPFEIA
jgi:hypothetical protein